MNDANDYVYNLKLMRDEKQTTVFITVRCGFWKNDLSNQLLYIQLPNFVNYRC